MVKVSTLRRGSEWHASRPHLQALAPIWNTLQSIPTLQDSYDRVAWTASRTGLFTLKSAYHHIRPTGTIQPWQHCTWFKGAIPRFSFIAWLLFKGKLTTLDRLYQWGTIQHNTCYLCLQAPETVNHLFFECLYSSTVWSAIISKCSIVHTPMGWDSEQIWIIQMLEGRQPVHTTRQLAFTSTVYHLWAERNSRIFKSISKPVHSTINAINTSIKHRLTYLFPQVQNSGVNRSLFESWQIQTRYIDDVHRWIECPAMIPGYINIYTDASLHAGMAGTGYIIRDDMGSLILAGAAGEIQSNSILFHELQAIHKGLMAISQLQHTCTSIQVFSDSKVAMNIINGSSEAPWTCWSIVTKIRAARSTFDNITFSFVHRQANQPADHLSHLCQEVTTEDVQIRPAEVPPQLAALINRDKQLAPYLRWN